MGKLTPPCSCLGSVTDIPCICVPYTPDPGWLERVLKQNEAAIAGLPKCLRARSQSTPDILRSDD